MEELIDLQTVQGQEKKDEIELPEDGTSLTLLHLSLAGYPTEHSYASSRDGVAIRTSQAWCKRQHSLD